MEFKELHYQSNALLVANVWDVFSAQLAAKSGYSAIGTSSAAIAKSRGVEDGENIPFSELVSLAKNIITQTSLPLTVDIEAGYSREPQEIIDNIVALARVGVVGINIEDSVVEEKRLLKDPIEFSELVSRIKQTLSELDLPIFINVRTDTFLIPVEEPLAETLKRIRLYEESGADGMFIPCIVEESDIISVVSTTGLPVNVMCMPSLPHFQKLNEIGVKRISMGNFIFENMYSHFEKSLVRIKEEKSFQSIFQ
ncbi:isocitrate lyase/phosphoenolpyruvate mutase family protein [Parashewanella curva]|uniref:Isocitrate lyase/phosphoenolpyruvate mutase family protein n=1 Tax=Parashewanella curva TaxID=2338552 RepID=A0A3L8PX43_9GAMM|nr:isocitrate lyase/phosphoenolpyruvate mutase family protein [Parashewanella curva]RLV59944.1 isocitrate lyase/phosphoenolpyruvate mutase family protein [Parashewanella curva]